MKTWIFAVAALLLAGCSAVAGVPTDLQTQEAAIQQSGGAFNVSDSGNFDLSGCGLFKGGSFRFAGSGFGTFIHQDTEYGSMTSGTYPYDCSWKGTATLVSVAHPRNSIAVELGGAYNTDPCHTSRFHLVRFTVSGGTGRFVHATGSGTVTFTCNSNGTYTDQWSGTVTF